MRPWPNQDALRAIHARMQKVARSLRLPFRGRIWKGAMGNWTGAGVGHSVDFQDHRPYIPGDDPRYLDWLAYARSGQYTMKLYREEASPRVDLVLDVSPSMSFDEKKRMRTLELFYFCFESAHRDNASLRCFTIGGKPGEGLSLESIHAYTWRPPDLLLPEDSAHPRLFSIPWRSGSLRIFISDLLYPAVPEACLIPLVAQKGQGLILAPFCEAESNPGWDGNLQFIDCEQNRGRTQRVDPGLLARYKEAYTRHVEIWGEQCRKHGIILARIPSEEDFATAVFSHAHPLGAVQTWT